jgi:hypothetical protein
VLKTKPLQAGSLVEPERQPKINVMQKAKVSYPRAHQRQADRLWQEIAIFLVTTCLVIFMLI